MAMTYAGFVCRVLLALIFLVAAVGKARIPNAFARTINSIGVHTPLAPVVAWGVIAYEAAIGLLYAVGWSPAVATAALLLLLVAFASVAVQAMVARRTIPYNCFGEAETALGGGTIARSLLLLVPLGIYYLCSLHVMAMWWPTSVDLAVTLSGLVIAALLLARWGLAATTVATLVRERRRCRDDT